MATLINYNGLKVVSPQPTGDGGAAINDNFKKLSTMLSAQDPTASDDSSKGYGIGSRWITNQTRVEWICTDATAGAAVWRTLSGRSQNASTPPANPVPGQIYFNTADTHFYGWNGSAWRQLDN